MAFFILQMNTGFLNPKLIFVKSSHDPGLHIEIISQIYCHSEFNCVVRNEGVIFSVFFTLQRPLSW